MAWPETESEVCSFENAACRANSQYAAIVAVGADERRWKACLKTKAICHARKSDSLTDQN